jgi:hypothetical protein
MLGQVLRTTVLGWKRLRAVFDSSFEVVCLFSALGIILSLVFHDVIAPAFDAAWTLSQLPWLGVCE